MFERIQFVEWQATITIVAFIVCFSAFIFFCWRAIRMKRSERRHVSELPLQQDQDKPPSSNE